MNINLYSPTGGTGCSTIASVLARELHTPDTVALIETRNDCRRILGAVNDNEVMSYDHCLDLRLAPTQTPADLNAYVEQHRHRYTHTITDWGTTPPAGEGTTIVVLTNTYLNLSRYRTHQHTDPQRHFTIAAIDHRLSLTTTDVHTVLGRPADATIEITPAIARSVDAGTIAHRPPDALTIPLGDLINIMGKAT